jgi:amino acid adenylation domain-containing protein
VETESLIGFFVNTLALRTDLSGNPSFTDLLGRVREVALAAYAQQDVPFEKIVEAVQPERSLSHAPLFQVMLALQNAPRAELRLGAIELERLATQNSTTKFDITLSLEERDGRLLGAVRYKTSLFDEATIKRMVGHLARLLEGIVADPEQPLSKLPLMTAAEERQLLVEWNRTTISFSHEQCVHQLFAQQVARTPEQVAVACEGVQLSHRELNARANQLAHYLQALGVRPDTAIGLFMERSVEFIVGLLGILKAGGAYVPLDPQLPPERLTYMIADARLAVLVTDESLLAQLPNIGATVVCLDRDAERLALQDAAEPISSVQAANLAYVIYTSGSTGQPKGVAVEHRQLANYLAAIQPALALPAPASYALVSTLAADLGHTMLFPALCQGSTLHLIAQERATDAAALAAYFEREQIDCLKIVPSHLAALVTSAQAMQVLPRQRLILGGEACRQSWVNEVHALAPTCRIFNHYGPTETTVGVLTGEVTPTERGLIGAPPDETFSEPLSGTLALGRPLGNTQVYLLDAAGQLVPPGVAGELYVGGAQVARGYLHRPELTAARFVPDPFSTEPGQRLYRTGDLARYLADGRLEFLGRVDRQVKLRGYRIELGEVEAALRELAQVREAVVEVQADGAGGDRLVAYVVAAGGAALAPAELRGGLSGRLPDYMLPAAFVRLEALPLTPNGKLDRRALPAPEDIDAPLADSFVAARNPMEAALIDIWSSVLSVERIGVHDNFFELGGHSLLAAQLMSRLRAAFQVELPLRRLFETPTVAGLALTIIQSQADQVDSQELEQLLAELEQLPE